MTCCNSDGFAFERAHTIGERLFFGITTEEEDDLTAVPLSIYLDSPDGQTRHVLRYLNDGTDGVLSVDTHTVTFTKTPEWSAENMTRGVWTVNVTRGDVDSDERVILGPAELNVIEPPYGALQQ